MIRADGLGDILPADDEYRDVAGFDAELHNLLPPRRDSRGFGWTGLCLYFDLDGSHADARHDQGTVIVIVDD